MKIKEGIHYRRRPDQPSHAPIKVKELVICLFCRVPSDSGHGRRGRCAGRGCKTGREKADGEGDPRGIQAIRQERDQGYEIAIADAK